MFVLVLEDSPAAQGWSYVQLQPQSEGMQRATREPKAPQFPAAKGRNPTPMSNGMASRNRLVSNWQGAFRE